jgi:hypothetical protein
MYHFTSPAPTVTRAERLKEDQVPRLSRRAVLVTGFIVGLCLWLVPAQFMHLSEPWNANAPGYPIALVITGLVLGFLAPSRPGAAVSGVFLGQLAVIIWRVATHTENGEFVLVGVVMLAGYTFVAAGIGAFAGSMLRRRMHPEIPVERRVSDRRA